MVHLDKDQIKWYIIDLKDIYLDDSSNNELATLCAAWCKQDMEVMLTIFPPLKLVEHSIRERSEALGTNETSRMEKFTIAIHYFCFWFKPILTSSTGNTF